MQQHDERPRALVGGLVAASLIAALAACGPTPAGPSSSPRSSAPATFAATPSASLSTPSPSPSPVAVYSHWQSLAVPEPLPHVYGGSMVEAAISFRGAYLAVGFVNGGCCDGSFSTDTRGVVWSSTDGLSWSLEPRAATFDLAHLTGLATDGRLVVAIGFQNLDSRAMPGSVDSRGAVWTSTDGRTWTRVTGVPRFSSVVQADGAFLASAFETVGPEIWRSADGRSWHRLAGPDVLGTGTLEQLVATPVGIVAVGWTGSDPDRQAAVSWRSLDGLSWTRAPAQASLEGAAMTKVAVSGGAIVAVGLRPDSAAAWWSTDGLTWTRSDETTMSSPGRSLFTLVAGAEGFITSGVIEHGSDMPTYPVWASRDGRTWGLIDAPLVGNGPSIRCAVDRGTGLTVFGDGFDLPAGGEVPAAWDVR